MDERTLKSGSGGIAEDRSNEIAGAKEQNRSGILFFAKTKSLPQFI
jgi:hypothetical protein